MMHAHKQARLQVISRHARRLELYLDRLADINNRFFWIRLFTFLLGGIASFLAFLLGPGWLGWGTLALSVVGFSVVVYRHRRVDRSTTRFKIALRLANTQIARMQLDWKAIPVSSIIPEADDKKTGHPFASDLNIFGEQSIHQLIDTAFSSGGSRRLLAWLMNPVPDLDHIHERQAILREIEPLVGFRNHLALNGGLVSGETQARWDGEVLYNWLKKQTRERSFTKALWILGALSAANLILFVLNAAGLVPAVWVVSFLFYTSLYVIKYRELGELFSEAYDLSQTLDKLRAILIYLETYPYRKQGYLSSLCEPFWQAARRPSSLLKEVGRIASAASLKNNPIVWLILNMVIPWDLFFGHRLEQAKKTLRKVLPIWLDAWYELEALNSLANFAYLNPDYVFPDLLSEAARADQPVITAQDIGHPLIPDAEKVTNHFSIEDLGRIAIITGSNMSGKSTFLRTLGINLCLAYTGSPVNAARLRTLPFRVFTSINMSDSLADGISFFYAEVRRLKALLVEIEKADTFPVFFLIDEIFRGTNNLERQIGSRAYVKALVGAHSAGVISTHDLELVHLSDALPGIRNYHFREDILGELMVFDYRLRPGPSPTTNALKIMQLEGLPVETVR